MQYIKFLSAVFVSINFLVGCTGSNASGANKNVSSGADESKTSSSGNASFSCTIDGQPVSGGQASSYQGPEGYQSNEAHVVDVDQGKELLFYLSDSKSTNSPGVHSLRFAVPDKTGNSSF